MYYVATFNYARYFSMSYIESTTSNQNDLAAII